MQLTTTLRSQHHCRYNLWIASFWTKYAIMGRWSCLSIRRLVYGSCSALDCSGELERCITRIYRHLCRAVHPRERMYLASMAHSLNGVQSKRSAMLHLISSSKLSGKIHGLWHWLASVFSRLLSSSISPLTSSQITQDCADKCIHLTMCLSLSSKSV